MEGRWFQFTTSRLLLATMWFAITLALLGYEIRAKKLSHIVIALMFTAAGAAPGALLGRLRVGAMVGAIIGLTLLLMSNLIALSNMLNYR